MPANSNVYVTLYMQPNMAFPSPVLFDNILSIKKCCIIRSFNEQDITGLLHFINDSINIFVKKNDHGIS